MSMMEACQGILCPLVSGCKTLSNFVTEPIQFQLKGFGTRKMYSSDCYPVEGMPSQCPQAQQVVQNLHPKLSPWQQGRLAGIVRNIKVGRLPKLLVICQLFCSLFSACVGTRVVLPSLLILFLVYIQFHQNHISWVLKTTPRGYQVGWKIIQNN